MDMDSLSSVVGRTIDAQEPTTLRPPWSLTPATVRRH